MLNLILWTITLVTKYSCYILEHPVVSTGIANKLAFVKNPKGKVTVRMRLLIYKAASKIYVQDVVLYFQNTPPIILRFIDVVNKFHSVEYFFSYMNFYHFSSIKKR